MIKVQFAQEQLDLPLWKEIMPLLVENHKETGAYADIPLRPNAAIYDALQIRGLLRSYTLRDEQATLRGYSFFTVAHNLHSMDSIWAVQDVLYLSKSVRGLNGLKFIKWVDAKLVEENVQVICRASKVSADYSAILRRQGYELIEYGYAKRTDKGGGK